jgi:hypothetical protein
MSEALAGHSPDVWEDDGLDEIEALMSEGPPGAVDNHGRKAAQRLSSATVGKDGEKWGPAHKSLDADTRSTVNYVAGGGVTTADIGEMRYHGGVSHLRPEDGSRTLTRDEMEALDISETRAAALEMLGFTEDDMAILDGAGGMTPAKRELLDRWQARLLEMSESGARMTDLARALGWTIQKAGISPRMRLSLKRARDTAGVRHKISPQC